MIDLVLSKAMSQHRGGLHDAPVGLGQAIEARNDEALDRLRQGLAADSRLVMQQLDEVGVTLAGPYAAVDQSRALHALDMQQGVGPVDAITNTTRYLNNRAATIYAGSSEVQRNILAGQLLKG